MAISEGFHKLKMHTVPNKQCSALKDWSNFRIPPPLFAYCRLLLKNKTQKAIHLIDHFTVACLVAWPLNENEAGCDLVLPETPLLFLCKFLPINIIILEFILGY